MTKNERDIQPMHKVLLCAEKIGDVGKTCLDFGVGSSSFDRAGGVWASGALNGKGGAAFTSTATQHRGRRWPPA